MGGEWEKEEEEEEVGTTRRAAAAGAGSTPTGVAPHPRDPQTTRAEHFAVHEFCAQGCADAP